MAFPEDGCGDVVCITPIPQKVADTGPHLDVRYLAWADHPHAFAPFLTNGGEAIPKFGFLNDTFVECGAWGPMPALGGRLSRGARPVAT